MKRSFALVLLFLLSGNFIAFDASAQDAVHQGQGIGAGIWEGTLALAPTAQKDGNLNAPTNTFNASLRLRILEKGAGALLDIPEQSMYGYPLEDLAWTPGRIRFILDALGPGQELVFDGVFSFSAKAPEAAKGGADGVRDPARPGDAEGAIIGTASSESWKGSFRLSRSPQTMLPGEKSFSIKTDDGMLPGTLTWPPAASAGAPLVLLLSGAGPTDRDGNNYNVPGRADALKKLSQGLAAKGVATYRYDKRGSGEAYMLERNGKTVSLIRHGDDAAHVIKSLRGMNEISRLIVAGMNEGAWIAADALNRLAMEGIFVDGFIVLDASGEDPADVLNASLAELDERTKAEAKAIVGAILNDKPYPEPSEKLADFFAPSRIDWLVSWLKFSPAGEIARVQAPVLFVYGGSDIQVSRGAFEKLLDARSNAAARLVPAMNYALKEVKSEEENYDSFTNPEYPVPAALVDLIAAFAKAKPAPAGTLPYERKQDK